MYRFDLKPVAKEDNVWLQPYSLLVQDDGRIKPQSGWTSDAAELVGFVDNFGDNHKIKIFWESAVLDPSQVTGMYPVIASASEVWSTYNVAIHAMVPVVAAQDGQTRAAVVPETFRRF